MHIRLSLRHDLERHNHDRYHNPSTDRFSYHQSITYNMAAMRDVLYTVELLELILYKLPTRDLLFAQKICKHWKALVAASPKLQRALFFKPIDFDGESINGKEHVIVLRNPLLEPFFELLGDAYLCRYKTVEAAIEFEGPHESWLEPHASSQKMLSSQPPLQSSFILTSYTCIPQTGANELDLSPYGNTDGEMMLAMDLECSKLLRAHSKDLTNIYIWCRVNTLFTNAMPMEKGSDFDYSVGKLDD